MVPGLILFLGAIRGDRQVCLAAFKHLDPLKGVMKGVSQGWQIHRIFYRWNQGQQPNTFRLAFS